MDRSSKAVLFACGRNPDPEAEPVPRRPAVLRRPTVSPPARGSGPRHALGQAGIVSGVLSSMQQVGNALGVAITGAIFFGALPGGGYAHAFAASLIDLALLGLILFGVASTLPKPSPSSRRG